MPISADQVRHVARLARLDLTPEEVERFRNELSKILEYVARIESLEAGSTDEPHAPDQPLRADRIGLWPDLPSLYAEAPDFADGFFRVPRVVE